MIKLTNPNFTFKDDLIALLFAKIDRILTDEYLYFTSVMRILKIIINVKIFFSLNNQIETALLTSPYKYHLYTSLGNGFQ